MVTNKWFSCLITKRVSIAPLVIFRIIFGLMMAASTIRFGLKGWISELYINPKFYFTFYGFDWVSPINSHFVIALFILLLLFSILICVGLFYRFSTISFFLIFTYIELIDKTNYLNHYYFISLISFLLIFLPANRLFSLDVFFKFCKLKTHIPAWTLNILKFQIGVVYFFAGIAKLNYYWLIEAQPLINWLKHQTDLPLIGELMKYNETAYIFSWASALFDIAIVFILLNKKTRFFGYLLVVFFHTITSIMFPIGVFPLVMIASTLIFFSSKYHQKVISFLSFSSVNKFDNLNPINYNYSANKTLTTIFSFYIFIQLLIPFRHLLYPGNLFWTEQGYRFSWRVMLIEKSGSAKFFIYDNKDRPLEIENCNALESNYYLTPQQEKMMATQPDMILQYAKHLNKIYNDTILTENNGTKIHLQNPKVTVEAYVSLFNKGSRLFIDPKVNLAQINRGLKNKEWILPYED